MTKLILKEVLLLNVLCFVLSPIVQVERNRQEGKVISWFPYDDGLDLYPLLYTMLFLN